MLQSIEHQSGLPIALDPMSGVLHLSESTTAEATSVRTFEEMRDFIREPDARPVSGKPLADVGAAAPTARASGGARPTQDVIYTVYRGVARRDDAERIAAAKLRYDITLLSPGCFAGERREFFRTAGHYHAPVAHTTTTYPEVYEVISGRANWIMQRPSAHDVAKLAEIYVIAAGPGEKAIIPSGFGHMMINAHAEPLVAANWIHSSCSYDYEPFRTFRGCGYWALEGQAAGTVEFALNPHYATVPNLGKLRPREVPELGLIRSRPLYALAGELEKLAFLSDPERFADILALDRCYRRVV